MKNTFEILKNQLFLMLKNKIALISLIIMPVAMIGLMGYALKPFLNVEKKGIGKFSIIYANYDSGEMGKSFDKLMNSEGIKYFNIIKSDSKNIDNELLSKNLDEAIVVPEDFTKKAVDGEETGIMHLSTGKNVIKQGVVHWFLENSYGMLANRNIVSKEIGEYNLTDINTDQILNTINTKVGNSFVSIKETTKTQKLNSYQYFSAGMLVFFLLTTGMGLGSGIIEERSGKIFSRIRSYPVTNNQYLFGKVIGNALIGVFQAIMVVIATKLLFNVDWGNDYFGLAVVTLLVIFISSGIAVVISGIVNSIKVMTTVSIVIYWVLSFVSGAFSPIPAFDTISKFIPNKWAVEVITGFMTSEGIMNLVNYITALLTVSIALWILGIFIYRRRVINE